MWTLQAQLRRPAIAVSLIARRMVAIAKRKVFDPYPPPSRREPKPTPGGKMTSKKTPAAIHVTARDDGWATKRAGSTRASGTFDTKAEAVAAGRATAKAEKGQLIVHGKDDKIQEERTYRKDPLPPKG
jgi:hypothetical protein